MMRAWVSPATLPKNRPILVAAPLATGVRGVGTGRSQTVPSWLTQDSETSCTEVGSRPAGRVSMPVRLKYETFALRVPTTV